MSRSRTINVLLLVVALVMTAILPAFAQSTTKSLSTNFTLVNLSANPTSGTVDYYKTDGSAWRSQETFNLPGNGGQAIFRQYTDAALSAGQGSVVVGAGEAVGSVVQILARSQNPTSSGAYVGLSDGDSTFYVPLAARRLATSSGLANSQIIIQNTDTANDANVEVEMIGGYTKTINGIKPGASYLYDLDQESNLAVGWYGSAVVRSTNGREIAVVSNYFTGDTLQTFNGFPSSAPGSTWYVPLFTSRLANTLSTPVAVQNLSGGNIAAGQITLNCTPDPASGGAAFSKTNTAAVGNNAAYYFNPVTDASIPALWYGACTVTAPGNVVVFVQMRNISLGEAAAYEAFRSGGDKVIVPLVAKRLGNGFATAVTIQNLDPSQAANVNLLYTPAPEYVAGGGSGATIAINNVPINAGASFIQNHRTAGGVSQLPAGWYGTLTATSTGGQDIAAFVQLTFLSEINPGLPSGDNFMAHTAFTVQ